MGGGARRGWLSPLTGDGSLGFSLAAVLGAVSVAVLSYLGFDAIASFAEEVTGGSAKVARAVLFCLALTGVLFVAQTYLAALLTPVSSAELAARPAEQGPAFYDTVESATGPWLHDLVAASKAIGAAFAALAGQAAAGRLLFAMAREGRLPRALARTSGGTPRPALLVAAVVTLVAAVWAARRDDGLDHLVSVVDVGALVAFTLLHASVVGWFVVRRREGEPNWFKHLVVPVLGAAVTVTVIVEASWEAQVVGAVWLAVGLCVLVAQRGRRGGPRPRTRARTPRQDRATPRRPVRPDGPVRPRPARTGRAGRNGRTGRDPYGRNPGTGRRSRGAVSPGPDSLRAWV